MVKQPTRADERESAALLLAEELLDVDGSERAERLAAAGADDPLLRRRVEELLALEDRHGDFPLIVGLPDIGGLREPPEPDFEPGARIGGFELVRSIASGGMGSVFEAEQQSPRRRVALKTLRLDFQSEEARRRFRYEAEVLALLRHPGIAQVYEAGVHREDTPLGQRTMPYFAMEFVPDARTLTDYAREEALGTRATLELFARFCDAVQHGHQRGVIHRDLKPGNLLVDSSGQPKVIDFGVARATGADLGVTTVETQPGRILGTIQYMSPEQVGGDPAAVDARADVYGLGVVLYELLCGRLPYDVEGEGLAAWSHAITHSPPLRPRAVHADLETIVLKALEKDSERRYTSAAALADDVRRYLSNEPIEARPASVSYQLRMFARRNRALTTSVVLVTLIALVAAGVSLRFALRARNSAELAERRYAEMRTVSRELLFGVYDAIDGLPGATAARAQVVRTSLATLDRLADDIDDEGGDPELRRELAEGYARLARVLGYPTAASMGDTEGALEAYDKSLGLVHNVGRRAELLREKASVLRQAGRASEALALQEEALALARDLDPEDPDQGRLVAAIAQTGDAHLELGDARIAEELYLEALELAERAALARDVHVLLNKLGDLDLARGDREAATARFVRSLEFAREMRAAHPGDVRTSRDLGSSLGRMGNLELESGRPQRALELFSQGLELAEERVAADANDAVALLDTAMGHNWIAEASRAMGDGTAARASFELADAAYLELTENDLGSVEVRFRRGVNLVSLAETLRDTRKPDEALATVGEAVEVLEEVVEKDEDAFEPRRRFCIALDLYGSLLLARRRLPEALAALERYHAFAADAVEEHPDSAGFARQRMVAEDRMGMVHQALGRDTALDSMERIAHLEQALEWYERSLATSVDYEERGLFQPDDSGAFAAIEAELPICEREIRELEADL